MHFRWCTLCSLEVFEAQGQVRGSTLWALLLSKTNTWHNCPKTKDVLSHILRQNILWIETLYWHRLCQPWNGRYFSSQTRGRRCSLVTAKTASMLILFYFGDFWWTTTFPSAWFPPLLSFPNIFHVLNKDWIWRGTEASWYHTSVTLRALLRDIKKKSLKLKQDILTFSPHHRETIKQNTGSSALTGFCDHNN